MRHPRISAYIKNPYPRNGPFLDAGNTNSANGGLRVVEAALGIKYVVH